MFKYQLFILSFIPFPISTPKVTDHDLKLKLEKTGSGLGL